MPASLLQSSAQRRFSEFLMPAAVILAGVLVVVAFAFIVNRAMQNDDTPDQSFPLPAPPALGDVPLAPTDQALIPIPSPSETSPSPAPPTTTPPAKKTKPPADHVLRLAKAGVPSTVDLSGEGRLDWVHWGEQGTFALERASGGDFKILEGAPTAPREKHTASPERFTWSGGSPVESSAGSKVGIHTCDKGNGFTLSVPAAKTERTLRLYLGAIAAEGRLEAKLSTGGSTVAGSYEQRANTVGTTRFTITYRAPKDGKLNLSWVTTDTFTDGCGGVAIQAATLR